VNAAREVFSGRIVVETHVQLDLLESLGCDRAQGFLFARPGEVSAVDELIVSGTALTT
jgi:EAL domain-containing protein (putative c-di-GMP-specific phosphodiesterase class I)